MRPERRVQAGRSAVMTARESGRSAAYDLLGRGYALHRCPDPRIAAKVDEALGEARSVLNVGAGTGSYEPRDRQVLAVEPSAVMIAQRPVGAPPAIRAEAEALPLPNRSFDAAMALLTVHHWSDWRAGLAELSRVTSDRVVVLAADARQACDFWLVHDYLPELEAVHRRFPPLTDQAGALGSPTEIVVDIPHDCKDGFLGAYWRRPHAFLNPDVRAATSVFAHLEPAVVDRAVRSLRQDLSTGRWMDRNRSLLDLESLDLGYRILVQRAER